MLKIRITTFQALKWKILAKDGLSDQSPLKMKAGGDSFPSLPLAEKYGGGLQETQDSLPHSLVA